MNRATLALLVAVLALGVTLLPLALGGGELGVTNFDDLTLSGDLVVGDDVTVTGDTTFAGTVTGAISNDLNAALMIIDADADTTLRAAVDDIVALTSGAATGYWNVLVGNLKIGNGTPGVSLNGEDAYIEGTLEVDGASQFDGAVVNASTTQLVGAVNLDGAVDLDGVITNAEDLEHIGVMTHLTTAFTYTAAAGGTVTLATIGAGEEWLVHNVYLEVTTNFDCTGDDCVAVLGDGNDTDGFCVLADAELQAADTEGTGWSAGWQCQVAATRGVYQDGTGGFMYDEAGPETIDVVLSAAGNDFSAGAATAHIFYTRLP